MTTVSERFLKYIRINTQSAELLPQGGSDMNQDFIKGPHMPSTEGQITLARELKAELEEMGLSEVCLDANGYLYGKIPPSPGWKPQRKDVQGREDVESREQKGCRIGLIAHMDTAPAYPGGPVHARILTHYTGEDIVLNQETGAVMRTADHPELLRYVGQDIIHTDGSTLLGADDKAGIAEIMTMAEYLLNHPEIVHGPIAIAFTPDEEIGRGADRFDVNQFDAQAAFTVDGGSLGELEYENFNAAFASVTLHGVSIHPGTAKGVMRNAVLMGMEFQSMVPVFENPMYTDGYEGFYHLDSFTGDVETARMNYIIRDHDRERFEEKKRQMEAIAAFLTQRYGQDSVELEIADSYYNMKEKIQPHMYLIHEARKVMEELGIAPVIRPIRGGTDGARLSYMGLPCPNLCTGGHNFHGKYEYIPIQSMEKVTELLVKLAAALS